MISIVVIYNDKRALNEILLDGLKNQTVQYDLIALDNTQGIFKSAAEALNSGANKAKGKYIMFIHQDVELGSDSWLEDVEKILDSIPDLGVAGVVGMSEKGSSNIERRRGHISSCGEIWSEPLKETEQVQTLDELLMIVPKSLFGKLKFDEERFDGWHCYGVDYCLSAGQLGLKSYVLPAFVYHRSLRSNVQNIFEYQKRLYNKHRKNYKNIYATVGDISWSKLQIRYILNLLKPLSGKLSSSTADNLKKDLFGYESVLDLGCGCNSPIQHCNVPFSVGVDLFEPYLEESKKKAIHSEYIKADMREVEFEAKSFDAVLCSEVLEHLIKEDGYELIDKMAKWARNKVIITTPNGYLWQDGFADNPLQEHKSSWRVEDFQQLGFKVKGLGGWKKLRGYKGFIKYRPASFWGFISGLSQKITSRYPKFSFRLYAVKEIGVK
jgi:2-polyprenyl-3-methyl-5-hydroxy-6-metoxy-1,4-benzoquinol methylase